MGIVPDDKNWTWVLERPCPECGFTAETFDVREAPSTIQDNARQWAELLAHPFVAADLLARAFADVGDGEWQRTGFRSDGAAFTIDSFARYMVHDPVHHVHDVEQGYAALSD